MPPSLGLELWKLDRLKPDPTNPRKHSAGQIEKIRRSIKEFGFTNPILAEPSGLMIAGHGRLQAAKLAELAEVPVLVIAHLTPGQRRALVIADNQLAEGSTWDEQLLAASLEQLKLEDFDLSLVGFTDKELADLVNEPDAPGGSDGDEEDAPEPMAASAAAPWVKHGSLYALGPHRVFVGDSLIAENRARLLGVDGKVDAVITDPPYAIYGSSSGVSSSIADDKMVLPFFEALFRAAADHLKEFGHLYSFCDWRGVGAIYKALARVPGLTLKNKLVWDKGGSGLGSNYANSYEEVVFAHRLQPKRVMKGDDRTGLRAVHQPNIQRANRPAGAERLHNAAKPVGLLSIYVEASTDRGERIWEPFSGSGSTLIACEKLGRICLAGEDDPVNAQITIERWQRLSGQKATEIT